MPGFNAQTIVNKVRTGNGVVILVGDVPVGFGQTSTQTLAFNLERYFGIGSKKVQEQQQLRYEPSITLDTLQLTNSGLTYFGYTTTWIDILVNTELNIAVVDQTGAAILTFIASTAQDYTSTVPANQAITEATTFAAMDIWDATGTSILNDGASALLINVAAAAASVVLAST
jgi:hypothetical protein